MELEYGKYPIKIKNINYYVLIKILDEFPIYS